MPGTTFPDFTLEASPSLTDYIVGYRTPVSGGERRTTLQSVSDLLGSGYFGSLTANRLLLGQGNSTLGASDLSYSTPTLTVPDAFNISSAGSIALTGGGTNKDITAVPSGTGSFIVAYNGSATATFSGKGALITGSDSLPAYYSIQTWGASSSGFESFVSGGTKALPTAVADGTKMFSLRTGGYDGTSYVGARGYIEVNAVNNWSTTNRGTTLIIGTTPPNQTTATQLATFGGNMVFRIGGTNMSVPAWGTSGVISTLAGATFTDTTSSGTVASAVGHSFGRPTIAANSATTITDASTIYIGNPPAVSTNVTITNTWAQWIDNGNFRLDGSLYFNGITGSVLTDTSGAFTLTGGAGNMTITAGTGNSRTLTLRTTTSGGSATTAVTISDTQSVSFARNIAVGGATSSSTTALICPAGSTAISSIRLPHGAAPSAPVDGDMWTTSSGLFVRINGSTVGPLS